MDVFDEGNPDSVMKNARKKYKAILADVPEFDKGSRFLFNILSCAALSAILLSAQKKYDLEIVRL